MREYREYEILTDNIRNPGVSPLQTASFIVRNSSFNRIVAYLESASEESTNLKNEEALLLLHECQHSGMAVRLGRLHPLPELLRRFLLPQHQQLPHLLHEEQRDKRIQQQPHVGHLWKLLIRDNHFWFFSYDDFIFLTGTKVLIQGLSMPFIGDLCRKLGTRLAIFIGSAIYRCVTCDIVL